MGTLIPCLHRFETGTAADCSHCSKVVMYALAPSGSTSSFPLLPFFCSIFAARRWGVDAALRAEAVPKVELVLRTLCLDTFGFFLESNTLLLLLLLYSTKLERGVFSLFPFQL